MNKQPIKQMNRKVDIDENITDIVKESQESVAYCIILSISWIYRKCRYTNW